MCWRRRAGCAEALRARVAIGGDEGAELKFGDGDDGDRDLVRQLLLAKKPLVLNDGTIISGLRVRFEDGVAVEIDADENAEALRRLTEIDEGARRLGELALVDGEGRIRLLDTVFYEPCSTRTRRATSRSATASRSWLRKRTASVPT